MAELTTSDLREALEHVAAKIEEKKDWLCELDGHIGDADHGITMSVGFKAVSEALKDIDENATPTDLLNQSAKSLLNAMGGSAGPLFATAFMRAGAKVKGKTVLDSNAVAEMIAAMAEGIQSRGKAEQGEKTMLDAWLPAQKAALQAIDAGLDMMEMMQQVATKASEGAESTKELKASKGRASRLGDRTIGHIDPGAASTALILNSLSEYLSKFK